MTPEQARTLAATVKAAHVADRNGECPICYSPYPCDVAALAEAVETLTAEPDGPWTGWQYQPDTPGEWMDRHLAAGMRYPIDRAVFMGEEAADG